MRYLAPLNFWLKTFLYRFTPGGFGYYRYLKTFYDSEYLHERDKHPVRYKHHGEGGWHQIKNNGFLYRDYESYQEYVTHQKQKFHEMLKISGGFSNRSIASYRYRFYRRFKFLPSYIDKSGVVLCAGTRQGTEVEVLQDLGFTNAYGIDLNPGPKNPWVRVGDFMKLEEKSNSIDLFYSNSVDHAFQLEDCVREHYRVVKPLGYALFDIPIQDGGAFESVSWDSPEKVLVLFSKFFKTIIKVEREKKWLWVLFKKA